MTTATLEEKVGAIDDRLDYLEKINKLVTKDEFNIRMDAFGTKLDLIIEGLRKDAEAMEIRLVSKMEAMEIRLDNKMEAMETRIETNMENHERVQNANLKNFEKSLLGEMKSLKWFIGIGLPFGLVMLGIFIKWV